MEKVNWDCPNIKNYADIAKDIVSGNKTIVKIPYVYSPKKFVIVYWSKKLLESLTNREVLSLDEAIESTHDSKCVNQGSAGSILTLVAYLDYLKDYMDNFDNLIPLEFEIDEIVYNTQECWNLAALFEL